jgi:cold-inducible RNA-binding protein
MELRGLEMNIFVGNLNYASTEESVRSLFEQYGAVDSVKVIKSWDTGRSRGFGFVEMPNQGEAETAISAADGQELDGRPLRVNLARPRSDRGGAEVPREDRR